MRVGHDAHRNTRSGPNLADAQVVERCLDLPTRIGHHADGHLSVMQLTERCNRLQHREPPVVRGKQSAHGLSRGLHIVVGNSCGSHVRVPVDVPGDRVDRWIGSLARHRIERFHSGVVAAHENVRFGGTAERRDGHCSCHGIRNHEDAAGVEQHAVESFGHGATFTWCASDRRDFHVR